MNRSYGIARRALLLVGLFLLSLCGTASANHNALDLVSRGPNGGNGPFDAIYAGSNADGSRVWFMTNEQLVSGDTDASQDVYERSGNTTTLISTGPNGGNGAVEATFDGASADGSRVFFHTTEKLVSQDTDSTLDLYQRSGTTTTILSIGSTGGNGVNDVFYVGNNKAGTRVWFVSYEQLTSEDTDGMRKDLYESSGGSLSLISTSPTSPNGNFGADFAGASDDGSHVFFVTDEPLVAADNDGNTRDVYERIGTTTNLVSIGPAPGAGTNAQKAFWGGTSADGTHVFFQTTEKLTTDDTDGTCVDDLGNTVPCADVYERSGGNTTLVSTSATSPNGPYRASFGGVSSDGSRVFFQTDEPLDPSDTDNGCEDFVGNPVLRCIDVYQRSGGNTTLVSTSPTSPNGAYTASFLAVSQDGSRVFFKTDEPLVGTDTDSVNDIYERSGGNTSLISTGPVGGNGPHDASFNAISNDGARVFFTTFETLTANDTDSNLLDIYERVGGTTTLISIGPAGGSGATFLLFAANTQDGSRVYFQTDGRMVASDTDSTHDVYVAIAGFSPPIGASPMRVSFVPAFQPCTVPASNATHNAPLAGGSCNAPVPRSSLVAVGPLSAGFVRLKVLTVGQCTPFNPALCYPDLQIAANITDVRSGSPSGPDYGTSSAQDLSVVATLPESGSSQGDFARITDKYNKLNAGTNYDQAATTEAVAFPIPVSCTTTSDTTVGSTCAVQTSGNSLVPGAVAVGNRAVWEIGQLQVLDQGADGVAGNSDDKVFEVQGVFVP